MFGRSAAAAATAVAACAFLLCSVVSHRAELLLGSTIAEEDTTSTDVNPEMSGRSAVLDLTGPRARSIPLPPRTVALTFDDGPDPVWTPRIARVLDRHGVPGTFYVVGQEVVRHPSIVRDLHESGHEIGNHTYTHPRLGDLPEWQVRSQTELTQRAVVGATGSAPQTFRPPYSGTPDYFPTDELRAAGTATHRGLVLMLSTQPVPDFDPGASSDDLLAEALPPLGAGAIVTLHDGGGERHRTEAALEQLIPTLKAQGYRFVTASEMASLRPPRPPTVGQRSLGLALLTATAATSRLSELIWWAALVVLGLTFLRTAIMVPLSERNRRRARIRGSGQTSDTHPALPPVSVIVPVFNEREVVAGTVRTILESRYPELEVVVVDDGSTDGTAQALRSEEFSGVRVLRKPNGGKASALDAGVRAAGHDIVVLIDGDTLLEETTLEELIRPFADPDVAAVAGNPRVGNRSGLLGLVQHVEYTIASAVERRMFDELGVMPCVPGAIGAFRRKVVLDLGGISSETLAEDTDLTMAIARQGWRVAYAPGARAWTEVPSTLRGLYRQRLRWNYGILQSVVKHRRAVTETGPGGRMGRIVLPYLLLLGYAAALVAPAVDLLLITQLVVGRFDASSVAMWIAVTGMSTLLGAYALWLEGDRLRLVAVLPLQTVLYRQLLYLTIFQSIRTALSGVRLRWNKLERTGDATVGGVDRSTAEQDGVEAVAATTLTPDEAMELTRPLGDELVIDLTDKAAEATVEPAVGGST